MANKKNFDNLKGDGKALYDAFRLSNKTAEEVYRAMSISNGTFYKLFDKEFLGEDIKGLSAAALGRSRDDIFGEVSIDEDDKSFDPELSVKEGDAKQVITLGRHVPLRLKPEEYADAFGDWKGLPMYNEPITAGFVATYRDELAHRPQYYLHDPRFRDCNFGAIITGDSMHSEIRHGDYAACKEIEDFSYITYGDIYYIVAKNGLETCKYIQRMKVGLREGAVKSGAGGGRYDELDIIYDDSKVLLVPYNRIVDPSPLPIDMILRLYKVRGIVRGY